MTFQKTAFTLAGIRSAWLHGLLALSLLPPVLAQDLPTPPDPPRLVNDLAGLLQPGETDALERKLVRFNDTTSTQIAVVIIATTGGYPISDYAFKLGESWGIGRKGKNNGALVLVARDDREVFIATGYGLEGAIPDALAKRIVETQIVPAFKAGDFYRGLDEATDTMIGLASGEFTADDVGSAKQRFPWGPVFFLLIMLILFMIRAGQVRSYAHRNGINWFAAWMLLNAARRRSGGSWGSFSGGGGSGGGFGGFGGGSFGGGGAGGRW